MYNHLHFLIVKILIYLFFISQLPVFNVELPFESKLFSIKSSFHSSICKSIYKYPTFFWSPLGQIVLINCFNMSGILSYNFTIVKMMPSVIPFIFSFSLAFGSASCFDHAIACGVQPPFSFNIWCHSSQSAYQNI